MSIHLPSKQHSTLGGHLSTTFPSTHFLQGSAGLAIQAASSACFASNTANAFCLSALFCASSERQRCKVAAALFRSILAVNQKLSEIFSNEFEMIPLIRFKLVGTLAKGFSGKDVKLELPLDKAIFSVTKKFESALFKRQIDNLKELQKEKKGVIEMGITILEKNVEDANLVIDTRRLFDLLSNDEIDKAQNILLKN